MNNIHDWCISRQLWWGHQIPAWYCEYGHLTVARERPADCAECHSGRLTQDPDVLDTWFSSGLWRFSTFGWPEDTPPCARSNPNSVMETGFDILFFWRPHGHARPALHGRGPFRHRLPARDGADEKGEKMSKTRGTSSTRSTSPPGTVPTRSASRWRRWRDRDATSSSPPNGSRDIARSPTRSGTPPALC